MLRYDLAVFDTRVRDELVPFEIAGSNGRRYFRNAGRTRRQGAEVGTELTSSMVSLLFSYTYSHFRFTRYESGGVDFSGNRIPGIPRHRFQSSLRLRTGRTFALIENEATGRTYVDDANTTTASGYAVTNARLGSDISRGRAHASVVLGVQNIFDRVYASSLAVNAARGKYFEPAPGRAFFVGLSIGTGERR